MKAIRTLVILVGWIAAAVTLSYAIAGLDFHWNFFNWSPTWDVGAIVAGLVILSALVGIWFLANATRDSISRVVSVLVCLILVVFAAAYVLPAEPATGGFLGRSTPSPLWFRGGCFLLLSLPSVFWLLKVRFFSTHDDAC